MFETTVPTLDVDMEIRLIVPARGLTATPSTVKTYEQVVLGGKTLLGLPSERRVALAVILGQNPPPIKVGRKVESIFSPKAPKSSTKVAPSIEMSLSLVTKNESLVLEPLATDKRS